MSLPMVSKDKFSEILSRSRLLALSADVSNDDEFVMASFAMLTLQACLEDRYDLRLGPRFEEAQLLRTVNEIHAYSPHPFPDPMAR
jgi:hypothetical protein